MTVIEASSAGVRDMADGSLRITFEFEPRFSRDAYALFGARGTPVAVAALKPASSKPEKEERPFRGELCRWTAIRCTEPAFTAWIESAFPAIWAEHFKATGDAEEAAAEVVRSLCSVASRVELDTNAEAAALLKKHVMAPYKIWMERRP